MLDIEREIGSIKATLIERGRSRDILEAEIKAQGRDHEAAIRKLRDDITSLERTIKGEADRPSAGLGLLLTDLRIVLIIALLIALVLGQAGIAPLLGVFK